MRLIITICCLAACASWADTITLKNGNRIVADSARESNGHVEYSIGENTYVIPKALVEKIEPGGVSASAKGAAAIDLPPVHEQIAAGTDLVSRVIRNGQIDTAELRKIENEGVAQRSAVANYLAANFEEKRQNLDGAAHYLQVALVFMPGNAILLGNYASTLLQLGRPGEALTYALQATQSNPESADAFALLGYAYYKNDRNREAIAAWKRSLELNPNDNIKDALARVERESRAEAGFRQQESDHFVLRYEGSQAPEGLRNQVLSVLEGAFVDCGNERRQNPRSGFRNDRGQPGAGPSAASRTDAFFRARYQSWPCSAMAE